ncbi:MAG: HDOD domain-containing protein [Planctomycetes bacterium]|nr:HDOD domain-containing protein [Planctomycetota bacterium]
MADSRPRLTDVLDHLTDMPALPTVVARLTRLIADPRTTASDINVALSVDPGLVTKILKLVNSSYYGFSRRITTITNAVVILGFNQVRNLALSAFIFDKFAGAERESGFDIKGFWKHCLGAAFIGSQIARHIDPKLEEDAFICGLLHDLGKFVMALNAPRHIAVVLDRVAKKDILFHAAEKECLDYDHAMLGAAVMERWNLPETLVNVVRDHHDPLAAPDRSRVLCCVTSLADIAARALLIGSGGDRKIPRLREEVWETTGLDWTGFEAVLRKAADEYVRSDAFFSI